MKTCASFSVSLSILVPVCVPITGGALAFALTNKCGLGQGNTAYTFRLTKNYNTPVVICDQINSFSYINQKMSDHKESSGLQKKNLLIGVEAPVGGGPGTLKLFNGCPLLLLSMVDTPPLLIALEALTMPTAAPPPPADPGPLALFGYLIMLFLDNCRSRGMSNQGRERSAISAASHNTADFINSGLYLETTIEELDIVIALKPTGTSNGVDLQLFFLFAQSNVLVTYTVYETTSSEFFMGADQLMVTNRGFIICAARFLGGPGKRFISAALAFAEDFVAVLLSTLVPASMPEFSRCSKSIDE
uniref:Uncharacterized protein n=1 Tax=Glossina palpalis gambiensis TaxID=67801 RepID=A0A1B0BFL2_9MUSC